MREALVKMTSMAPEKMKAATRRRHAMMLQRDTMGEDSSSTMERRGRRRWMSKGYPQKVLSATVSKVQVRALNAGCGCLRHRRRWWWRRRMFRGGGGAGAGEEEDDERRHTRDSTSSESAPNKRALRLKLVEAFLVMI